MTQTYIAIVTPCECERSPLLPPHICPCFLLASPLYLTALAAPPITILLLLTLAIEIVSIAATGHPFFPRPGV
jgi:hypothetical protein